MRLVRQQVEKRLSAMLGAEVTFEKLNFSLLSGTIEAQGVTVTHGRTDEQPLLTVRRLKAELSIGAAFKKELVINALLRASELIVGAAVSCVDPTGPII